VLWLWPWMTVGTMAAAPASESGGSGAPAPRAAQPVRHAPKAAQVTPIQPAQSRTITGVMEKTTRDMSLHLTTALSRSWTDLSHFFGRVHDVIVYERWMHATFGWALTPMQRLLPSGAWPMVYANMNQWQQPTRGAGPFGQMDMFGFGFDWWRGFANTSAWQGTPRWRQRLSPPQPRPRTGGQGQPADFTAWALAPALGFAAGLQGFAQGMSGGLFF